MPDAETLILDDGTRISVRPIEPSDKEGLRRAFDRLSPESRYRRFFAPLTRLSGRDLRYLTEIDHADHEALAAIEPESGEIIGVARYVRTDQDRAEASVVVEDDWHHRGIATGLLDRLSARARKTGITHFVALVLDENREAIDLFEHIAADAAETTRPQPGQLEILIELPEPGELQGSLLARALRDAARGIVTMNPWRVLVNTIRRVGGRSHNRPDR